MKKKTKSRQKSSLLIPFILAILICLCGVGVSAYLFYNNFFRSLSKQNETPVATISFKYKTAQRKFLERVVWDRLRQDSPVYNGDTIHTADLSEATLYFNDGTNMELAENTMAQVFVSEDGSLNVDLADGFASVDASESQNGATISMKGVKVGIEAGGAVVATAAADGKNASLQVLQGTVSMSDEKGNDVKITEGESLMLTETGVKEPPISVTAPIQNAKILYDKIGKCSVEFSWHLSQDFCDTLNNAKSGERGNFGAQIIIAKDKDFSNIVSKISATHTQTAPETDETQTATAELEDGVYYWKAETNSVSAENYSTSPMRLQVMQSFPPELIAPALDYTYTFRNKNPAVRFIWTESTLASSYKVEVADNASFSNPLINQSTNFTTSIISTLGAGKYWWRVTPFYAVNKIGYTKPSSVGTFSIEQKDFLSSPVLLVPNDNSIVQISDNIKSATTASFSWKMEREAARYTFSVSNNSNMQNAKIVQDTTDNFISLDAEQDLGSGKWYWSVVQYDEEGNASPASQVRSFTIVRGTVEQHTITPADSYRVADTLLPDVRFSWKQNLPKDFESVLQIARNESFSDIAYEQTATGTGQKGITLPAGTYFWRLVSFSSSNPNAKPLTTPPKLLIVVSFLDAPTLITPRAKMSLGDAQNGEFKWTPVKDADYYKLQILKDDKVLLDEIVNQNEFSVDMFKSSKFKDKTEYTWKVQAFANEVEGISSRLAGKVAEEKFILNRVTPVEIVSPKKGAKLDGIEAVLNPPFVIWQSDDDLSRAQLVLRKTDVKPPVEVLKVPSDYEMQHKHKIAPNRVKLNVPQGLASGNYEIIIYAKTLDGIDVSTTGQKEMGRFTVLPIPMLNAATGLTCSPPLFDAKYLATETNERAILLSWSQIPKATDYHVNVFGKNENLIMQFDLRGTTSCKIKFSELTKSQRTAFSNGTFKWTVQGLRLVDTNNDGKKNKVIQKSKIAESTFVIAIPEPTKPQPKGALHPYGE